MASVTFIFAREKAYNSQTVREAPSGGTERAVVFLGEALQQLGHTVQWVTTPEQLRAYSGSPDVVITQIASLLESFPKSKKIWWTHHFADQPVIQANTAYARAYADAIVTLSQCHATDFKQNLRLNSTTIGHGIWPDEIVTGVEKDPYRLIYASTPFRGLEKIPKLFKQIKEKEPRATIAICSSMATYGEPEKDAQYQKIFDELSEIPGVELKGSLNQTQLYTEFARSSIFFYPCIWPETYCMALDEAIAHGCKPVVTPLGALRERVFPVYDLKEKYSNPHCYPAYLEAKLPAVFRDKFTGAEPKPWLEVAREWEKLF